MLKRTLMTACIAATSCGLALGQQPGGLATPPAGTQVAPPRTTAPRTVVQERTERAEEGALRQAAHGQLAKASELIGTPVKSSDGTMVGTIKDLVVDTGNNEIAFVLLEGERASTEGYLVMPWAVAEYAPVTATNRTHYVTVHVQPQRLRGAPVVSPADFRNLQNVAWAAKVNTFYRDDVRTRSPNRFDRDGRRFDRDGRPGDARPGRDRLDDAAEDARDTRDRIRDDVRERRDDARERIRERADDAEEAIEDRTDDARERVRDRVEENLERADEALEESKNRRPPVRSLDTLDDLEDDNS